MKKINTLLSRPITQYLIITILAVLYAFNATPVIFPDSKGYIEMWLVRSYGYPFFLAFHKMLFGNYFITTVIFSQFIINIVAIFFLMRCIRALVPLKQWIAFILYAVLIFPAFFGTALAKTILSESLAYPLYLGVIGYLLKGIFLKQNKYFYFALLLSFGAITVRGQFLFLIPLILIAVLLTFYKFLFNRKTFLLMISCIATPFLLDDVLFYEM